MSRQDAAAETDGLEKQPAILQKQVSLLFQGLPVSLLANMMAIALLVWAYWPVASHDMLSSWFAVMLLVSLLRLGLLLGWRKNPANFATLTWKRSFIAFTAVTSLCWVLFSIQLFQIDDHSRRLLVAYILLGLVAGALTSLSFVRLAAVAYIAPVMLVLILLFSQMGDFISNVIVIAALLFLAGLIFSGQRIYRNMREQFELVQSYETHKRILQDQELRYRSLLDTAADAFFLHNENGVVLDVNQQACRSLGYSRDELIGMSVDEIEMTADKSAENAIWHRLVPGETVTLQGMHKRKDGSAFPVEIRMGVIQQEKRRLVSVLIRDVSKRLETEEALKASEKNFRSIFESSPMGIFIYELDSPERLILTDANPAADRILRIPCQQFKGKTIEEAFPSIAGTELPAKYREVASSGELWSTEEVEYRDNRIAGAYEVFAFRTLPGRIVVMFNDITHRKEVERLKSEFVSTVSHELRTPLTSLKGSIDLLIQQGELKAEDRNRLLEIARSNSTRLLQLINDLLDMQKIESSFIEFVLTETDVLAVLTQTMEMNQTYAAEKQIRVTLSNCMSSDAITLADAGRLNQVFSNLLSNAIKFSPAQSEVQIKLRHEQGTVRVEFEDCGEGVAEVFVPHLFSKFTQYDGSDSRSTGGTGLGLAIAKALVERMGGNIGYCPGESGGACFFVEIPAIQA